MVSSRYGLDSGGVDNSDAGDSLTPDSVPDGPVAPARERRLQGHHEPPPGNEIAENLPFGVVLFDSEQNVVYCNPQQSGLLKIDIRDCEGIEDWLRKGCRDPDYAGQVIGSWREHVWRKQLTRVFSLKTADEKLREIEFRSKLLDDGGLLLTLFDVTESRRSEDALRLTETKFNTVFEHVTIGVALVDRTGRFFEVNPALERMLGFPRWELRRMALNELVPPEEFEILRKTERELAAGVGVDERTLPIHFRKRDGQSLGADVTLSPIRDGGRQPLFTAYFIRDASAAEEFREDLRESREQNRALLEAIPDLILLLDGKGRIEDLIPPAHQWRGVKVAERWAGNLISDLWPEFSRESEDAVRESLRSGTVEEFTFWDTPDPEGQGVCISARVAPCGIDQVVAVVADETDRAVAREALSRQGLAFRHLKEAVILTDLRGNLRDWNPAAAKIFGYSDEEIDGLGLANLYASPGKAEEFNRRISRELTENREWRARSEFFRKDGRKGDCEVVFVPVEDEGGPLSLLGIHREIRRETLDDIGSEQIQHRIRNQLQMVGSLFGLELKDRPGERTGQRAMLEKFQARLRAVTRLQDSRLKGPGSGTVRLAAYARALADDLGRICTGIESGKESLAVFGDDSIAADLETAAPFGLLVAELGLAVFQPASGGNPVDETGGLNLFIQSAEGGMRQVTAELTARVLEELSLPTIECLVSQLRGRMDVNYRGGYSRMTICFPESAD